MTGAKKTTGIHHVTAIAADAQRNADFYTDVLGLRLVKRSVNQDDSATYHLYYGDEAGSPGTIMTFFPWQGIRRGRIGTGQVAATAFAIPESSLGWWLEHLVGKGRRHQGPERRFNESVVRLHDPDGLVIELVTRPDPSLEGWGGGTVPAQHAIRGFDAVTLWVEDAAPTASVLTATLGFAHRGTEGTVSRYVAEGPENGHARIVDLRQAQGFPRGLQGGGTVHHVAFRTTDDAAQLELRDRVAAAGLGPTEVIDRFWFRSVYFREPGEVLFELATDQPGFTIDEPLATLGTTLVLPPWFEAQRSRIEAALPVVRHGEAVTGGAGAAVS